MENDLISRQATIEAVCNASCGSGFCGVECDEVLVLRNMPSAQSEIIACGQGELVQDGSSLVQDCISRQAAIDALRTCYDTETVTMSNGDEYINYEDAVGEIEQLSSASQQKPDWAQKVGEYRKNAPSYVQNPLAWALYQVWKEYDERLFNHSRAERRTDDVDAES